MREQVVLRTPHDPHTADFDSGDNHQEQDEERETLRVDRRRRAEGLAWRARREIPEVYLRCRRRGEVVFRGVQRG